MGQKTSGSRFGDLRNLYKSNEWRKQGTNLYDPSYHISVLLALPILRLPLDTTEFTIVHQNILKHRGIVRLFFLVLILSAWQMHGVPNHEIQTSLDVLAPLVVVSGVAWFTIAIGTIKQELLPAAVDMTKWLFSAFVSAATISVVAAAQVLPLFVSGMLAFVSFALIFGAILYDYVDSLTIGTDDHARAFYLTSLAGLEQDGREIIETPAQWEHHRENTLRTDKRGKGTQNE